MKSHLRFVLALLLARSAMLALKLLKRNGTHFPGHLALKVYPQFLKYLAVAPKIIAITGTNGKTTSTNLILDLLSHTDLKIAHNSLGSNIQEGIIVTMLKSTHFWGQKSKVDLIVMEVDERVSPKIYPYIQPDYLLITNLFRDSYRRNAHVDFIYDILETSLPEKTRLVVNADDVVSSFMAPSHPRLTFGIAPLEHEVQVRDSLIQDVVICPKCDHKLTYAFNRYHHIGQVYCPKCHFTNLPTDIQVIKVDTHVHLKMLDKVYVFPKIGNNITDIYNTVSAIALLVDFGIELSTLQTYFKDITVVKTRFDAIERKGKRVIVMMAKDQNPVAVSRVFDYIRTQKERTCAVIFINENSEHHTGSENMAYYYDTDVEYLNQSHVQQVIGGGHRILDFKVRCLLAGIPEAKLSFSNNEVRCSTLVDFKKVEDVYVLYGTKTEAEALEIRERLFERIEKEVKA